MGWFKWVVVWRFIYRVNQVVGNSIVRYNAYTTSYWPFIVTVSLCCTISLIFTHSPPVVGAPIGG